MGIKCFLLEPTSRQRRWFRRYCSSERQGVPPCPLRPGVANYHCAMALGEDCELVLSEDGYIHTPPLPADDPRWPAACACGYLFTEDAARETFGVRIYRMPSGGEVSIHGSDLPGITKAPPGAMWFADWMEHGDFCRGPDGHCLAVVLPDGRTWLIDSQATNCTKPDDHVHKCWVRHGTPPSVTVDKNGNTCAAGGGSIQTPGWHGFLVDGELREQR